MQYFQMINAGSAYLFSTSPCEACEADCEDPNTLTVFGSKVKFLKVGWVEKRKPSLEIQWCEALDMAVCQDCYSEDSNFFNAPVNTDQL